MNTEKFENLFLDYLEGELSEHARAEFEAALEANAALRSSLAEYKAGLEIENELRRLNAQAGSHVEVKVMEKLEVEKLSFFWRLFKMKRSKEGVYAFVSVAACAVLVVLVESRLDTLRPEFATSTRSVSEVSDEALTIAKPEGRAETKTEEEPLEKQVNEAIEGLSDNVAALRKSNEAIKKAGRDFQAEAARISQAQYGKSPSTYSSAGAPYVDSDDEQPFAIRAEPSTRTYDSKKLGSGIVSSEQYVAYSENARVRTSVEPMSTFGVDVDSASYTNARRFLQSGSLAPKDAIRVEEFINYFPYQYPREEERNFGVNFEIAPSPFEKGRHLLKIALASRAPKAEQRRNWNLVFLMDVSGSMNEPNKLPLVKAGLTGLVRQLQADDKVSIVTYAGSVGTLLEPTSGKEKEKILAAIQGLSAEGGTYGSGGIQRAYELALANKQSDGVNRVILATDGDFNVGITSREELVKYIEEKRRSGITLTTLGFGSGNLNDGTLEQLANKGNGNYFYIDTLQEARRVLEKNLVSTVEIVAKDVKLQMEFNPAHVQEYRLIGYDNRVMNNQDFNNDAKDSGEIGAGHQVTALYEILLKGSEVSPSYRYRERSEEKREPSSNAFENELGHLKIRFKQPSSDVSELLEFTIPEEEIQKESSTASEDYRFAASVAAFAEILRESPFAASYSLSEVLKVAENARGGDPTGERREFIELVKNAQTLKR